VTVRDQAEVLRAMLALAPPGWAVPTQAESRFARLLGAFAGRVAEAEAAGAALLEEADPRKAVALLADYERVLGPDPCNPAGPDTDSERRRVAHQRWTQAGYQSRAFYIGLAASRGVAITIEERRPFKAGASKAGHPVAPRTCRFFWKVNLPPTRVIRFRAGASQAGQSLGAIVPTGAECPIRRFAPAHTTPVFFYSGET